MLFQGPVRSHSEGDKRPPLVLIPDTILMQESCLVEKGIGKGRLAVINVRNHGKLPFCDR
jgi:hypothetical protein